MSPTTISYSGPKLKMKNAKDFLKPIYLGSMDEKTNSRQRGEILRSLGLIIEDGEGVSRIKNMQML